jgi:hypothetical protein
MQFITLQLYCGERQNNNLNFLHRLAGALKTEEYAENNQEKYSEIN